MAVWGTRVVGIDIPVRETDELISGKTFEANFSTPVDIPDALEVPLITELYKLKDKVAGSDTSYVYAEGRTVTVQWKQYSASPIAAGTVILALIALAIVLAIALALVSISKVEGLPAGTFLLVFGGAIALILIIVMVVIPRLRR